MIQVFSRMHKFIRIFVFIFSLLGVSIILKGENIMKMYPFITVIHRHVHTYSIKNILWLREKTYGHQGGRVEEGIDWEFGIDTYTSLYLFIYLFIYLKH